MRDVGYCICPSGLRHDVSGSFVCEALNKFGDRANFDKVSAYFFGSSQILLLKRIKETLAGRVFVFELFPLMLSELVTRLSALIWERK